MFARSLYIDFGKWSYFFALPELVASMSSNIAIATTWHLNFGALFNQAKVAQKRLFISLSKIDTILSGV